MNWRTIQDINSIVVQKYGPDYEVVNYKPMAYPLGAYVVISAKCSLLHKPCGTIIEYKSMLTLLHSKGKLEPCKTCRKPKKTPYVKKGRTKVRRLKYDKESFQRKLQSEHDDTYVVVGEYTKSNSRVRIRHTICGQEWEPIASSLIGKNRTTCPYCSSHKVTTEMFAERIRSDSSGEYELVSDYVNLKTKFLVRHKVCGKEYSVFPFVWDAGKRCPFCAGKRLSSEDFVEKYTKKQSCPAWFNVLEYKNMTSPLVASCKECGHEYRYKRAEAIFKIRGCAKCCPRTKKLTVDQLAVNRLKMLGPGYKLVRIADFTATFSHDKCGREFDMSLKKHNLRECPFCKAPKPRVIKSRIVKNRKMPNTVEELRERIADKTNEYEVTSFDGRSAVMTHFCCGHKFSKKASLIFSQLDRHTVPCPSCNPRQVCKTQDQFEQDLKNLFGDNYTVMSSYSGGDKQITLRHNPCGHIFTTTWSYMCKKSKDGSIGTYCENCFGWNSSNGEARIKYILDNSAVQYVSQYSVRFQHQKTCPSKYDFAVLDNDVVKLLIEFDGEQHYRPVEYFGGDEKFKMCKQSDRRKDLYAWVKGIPLLRIPYWEQKNIEQILTDKLRELGLLPSLLKQYEYMSKGPLFFEWAA